MKKYRILSGTIILIISIFIFYYRRDILVELFGGRPLYELDLSQLLLPILLIVIGLFLIFKKEYNEKNNSDN